MSLMTSELAAWPTPAPAYPSATVDNLSYATAGCDLGRVLVARSAKGVCAVLIGVDDDELALELATHFPQALLVAGKTVVDDLAKLLRFVDEPSEGLHLTLDMRGTPFQRRVWEKIRAIPVGRKLTCRQLARWINPLASPRAVADACDANRIALAIPCHRVDRGNDVRASYHEIASCRF